VFISFGHNIAIILRKPQKLKVLHLLIELGFRISDLGFRVFKDLLGLKILIVDG
jgi:hypothetical protein